MSDHIALQDDRFLVRTPRPEKLMPLQQKRWSKADDAFVTQANLKNARILTQLFGPECWDTEASGHRDALEAKDAAREHNATVTRERDKIDLSVLQGRQWGQYTPFHHQQQALALASKLDEFGYFMDQGTGKTLCAINDAAQAWRDNKIKLVIVICPNNVKTNWRHPDVGGVDELSTHRPTDVPFVSHVWMTPQTKDNRTQQLVFERSLLADAPALHWLVVNVEALGTTRCQEYLHDLCEKYPTMIAVDESTRIKTPGAQRTKVALSLSRFAKMRRIMSGTPVIKAPENAWAQLRFLGQDAMPFESHTAFKKHFVVESRPFGFNGPSKIEGYRNMDQLSHLIDRVSFRVMKEECLDLPPKVYNKRFVDMLPEQKKAYEEMRKRSYVLLEKHGLEVAAPIILVQMLRLQQIACGFLPRVDEAGKLIEVVPLGDPAANPKIVTAMEIVEETEGKLIIWCNFTAQLKLMARALTTAGVKHVLFYGEIEDEDRVRNREAFQNDPDVKVFLGNPAAGGIGLTLTAAEGAIYLSNSFRTEDRVQSEDRCHRIGSDRHQSINYFDVITQGSIDEKVIGVLRDNKRMSDEIMRTGWKEWI